MKKIIVILFLYCLIPNLHCMTFSKDFKTTKSEKVVFEGFLGDLPSRIINAVKLLRIAKIEPEKAKTLLLSGNNILLLHGPCGNGKSTIPRKMAEVTGAHLIEMSGPSILDPYIGESEKTLKNIFQEAKILISEEEGAIAIIFIDEIDALTTKKARKEESREYDSIRHAFQYELDQIKNEARILVIGTTNNFEDFDKPIRDRFYPIEIKNPNQSLRFQILEFYWNKYLPKFSCNKSLLKEIAQQSEGLSIRALEQLMVGLATNAFTNDLTEVPEKIIREEFDSLKIKTLGTFINRLKEHASKASTALQTHIYPHISVIGSIATTIVAYFQIKSLMAQSTPTTAKAPEEINPEIKVNQIDPSSYAATAA